MCDLSDNILMTEWFGCWKAHSMIVSDMSLLRMLRPVQAGQVRTSHYNDVDTIGNHCGLNDLQGC